MYLKAGILFEQLPNKKPIAFKTVIGCHSGEMISQVLDKEIVPRTRDAKRHYAHESKCIFGCLQKLATDP
jgi:hypothetical protein